MGNPPDPDPLVGVSIFREQNYKHFGVILKANDDGSTKDYVKLIDGVNDKVHSLIVSAGCKVILWEHWNFTGHAKEHGSVASTSPTRIPAMWPYNFSSAKVVCDWSLYCKNNPTHPKCFPYCSNEDNGCLTNLASACNTELSNHVNRIKSCLTIASPGDHTLCKCRDFCKDDRNGCSDDVKQSYCTTYHDDPDCACVTYRPKAGDYVEMKLNEYNGGNNACWAKACRDGTGKKAGQFHLQKWWANLNGCRVPNICSFEMKDSTVDAGSGSINVINNCGADEEGNVILPPNTPSSSPANSPASTTTAKDASSSSRDTSSKNTKQIVEIVVLAGVALFGMLLFILLVFIIRRKRRK
jgi:hypothetical protein